MQRSRLVNIFVTTQSCCYNTLFFKSFQAKTMILFANSKKKEKVCVGTNTFDVFTHYSS